MLFAAVQGLLKAGDAGPPLPLRFGQKVGKYFAGKAAFLSSFKAKLPMALQKYAGNVNVYGN